MLRAIRNRDDDPHFFFAGDYCDRGPDTRGVVELLLDLLDSGRATCVRGNHDDIFDLCLNRHSFASGEQMGGEGDDEAVAQATELFWREGLLETMKSYGVNLRDAGPLVGKPTELAAWVAHQFDVVPASHKEFFRNLPGVAEQEDFFVVHATWPPDYLDQMNRMNAMLTSDSSLRYEVVWGRYTASQVRCNKVWSRRGYVGHTPTDSYANHPDLLAALGDVVIGRQVTLIDTACFSPSGRLSAICHETGDVLQVHHSGEVLE